MASAYVQGKTAPIPQQNKEITVSTSDERKKNYDIYERLIWSSFPDTDFSTRFPDPIPYTYEQLERECEQWLEYSISIAQADRDISLLTLAYQKIFNLPESTESPIYDDFPQENREILKGWKERFFTPGTKQYEWRVKYNHALSILK